MKSVSIGRLLILNTYWFGNTFMWNSLHVLIIPAVLLHWVSEDYKNTVLGLLTMLGLLVAMFVQPVSGTVSDSWSSRWGRRRPLMVLGTVADFLFLGILAWSGGLGWIALGYLGLQLCSNIATGPAQGLIPDQVPPEKLGRASGIKNLLDIAGLVISTILVGRLLTMETIQPTRAVALIMAVLFVAASITILGVREVPVLKRTDRGQISRALRDLTISIPPILKSPYGRLMASRFLFLAGIFGIQVFALYYVRDVIQAPDPIRMTANLLAVIIIAVVIFSVAGGWLGDRIGHQRVQLIACAIAGTGCLLMLGAHTPTTLLSFAIVLGVGIGLFQTSNWALAIQNAPIEQAGKYMGLINLASAGAGIASRLQGPFIDGLNNSYPGAWWGYSMLFALGAVGIAASAWVLVRSSLPNRASNLAEDSEKAAD
jgi:MFS family permease